MILFFIDPYCRADECRPSLLNINIWFGKTSCVKILRTVTIQRIFIVSENKKNLPGGNSSMFSNCKCSLPQKKFCLRFNHENVIKIKNKPDPALLRTLYLCNEIKKTTRKSHETIPLRFYCISIDRAAIVKQVVVCCPPNFTNSVNYVKSLYARHRRYIIITKSTTILLQKFIKLKYIF
jgi:hypothetical protein